MRPGAYAISQRVAAVVNEAEGIATVFTIPEAPTRGYVTTSREWPLLRSENRTRSTT
jgi:hypothetical protein